MGKRGPKPKNLVNTRWSSDLAYAVGLIATDGCLSRDGLLIDLMSKDKEQLKNFSKSLGIKLKIGTKTSGVGNQYFRVQFKNRIFYDFLISLNLAPAKSKTMGPLRIPDKYFFDFLRGCFDGDGSFYDYWDLRWRSSYMFYTEFCSSSPKFINWLRSTVQRLVKIKGHITKVGNRSTMTQLKYAKRESLVIVKKMYYSKRVISLKRKRLKIQKALGIVVG